MDNHLKIISGVAIAAAAFMLAAPACAQVQVRQSAFGSFDAGDTCYSWEGGHKSAGSFSKCNPSIQVAVLMPAAPPAPAPMAIAPVCPPQITVIPEPKKPRILRKRPPPVKC